jgi:hypothetical protein
MSNATKLTLPPKLKYGFNESNKLQEEIIAIFLRHDLVYILLPESESNWKAVQHDKLELLLSANNTQIKNQEKQLEDLENLLLDETLTLR